MRGGRSAVERSTSVQQAGERILQRRHFDKILARAGLPDISPYDLHHTCATLLVWAGEDVKVVSGRLGHSTCRLTLVTDQHVLPGMQERAAAKLDAIFNAPREAKKAE
jgi:integrase